MQILFSAWQKTPSFQKNRTSADTVNGNDFHLDSIFLSSCLENDNNIRVKSLLDSCFLSLIFPAYHMIPGIEAFNPEC
jgi:hypothetical protein